MKWCIAGLVLVCSLPVQALAGVGIGVSFGRVVITTATIAATISDLVTTMDMLASAITAVFRGGILCIGSRWWFSALYLL